MPSNRARAPWVIALALVAALVGPGCGGCSAPPPVPLEVSESTGPLVFPPPDDGWAARPPIPAVDPSRRVGSARPVHVLAPRLDDKGSFEVTGSTIDVEFDEPVVDPARDVPSFTVTPPVPTKTVWVESWKAQVRADRPFDPEVTYTLELPERTAPGGRPVAAFKGSFVAKPRVIVAGKVIHYVPKPGVARVVHMRSPSEGAVGPANKLFVLYDQPVELAVARQLVSVKTEAGAAVPIALSHPAGPTFEGEKVDPRNVVLVAMTPMPPAGTAITFEAKSQHPKDATTTAALTVAKPPTYDGVECGGCDKKDGALVGDATTAVTFKFSNPIRRAGLKEKLQIAPTPRNLSVSTWEGSVTVDAAWTPQTRYRVSASGLVDRFGFPVPPAEVDFVTKPRSAIAVLREGVQVLDDRAARQFFVTTRNVKEGELKVWAVAADAASMSAAVASARDNDPPSAKPDLVIPFAGNPTSDVYVESRVDLTGKLTPGRAYLAQVDIKTTASGAPLGTSVGVLGYTGYASGKPSVPLLLMADKTTLGGHVLWAGSRAVVVAYRLGTGEPAPGVDVAIGKATGKTDASGAALLEVGAPSTSDVLVLGSGAERTVLPLTEKLAATASALYPALTSSEASPKTTLVGFVITDRGVYRPGSTVHVKALARRADERGMSPAAGQAVRIRLVDAVGTEVASEARQTSEMGAVALDLAIPLASPTGRWHVRLELDDEAHTTLHDELVRVAEFEIPRFKVDVEIDKTQAEGRFKSTVRGTYAFGAPMAGGRVAWTLRKAPHAVAVPRFTKDGYVFSRESMEMESPPAAEGSKPLTGEGVLGANGELAVDVALGAMSDQPTDLTLEADVTDASYRHIAGRATVTRAPFGRFAGLRLGRSVGESGPVHVDAVVVDAQGAPVAGAPVEVRVDRLTWKRAARRGESGATIEEWRAVPTTEARCALTSAAAPVGCDLATKGYGSYRVVVRVDGRDDAWTHYYAWSGSSAEEAVPSAGKRVPIVTDKRSYRAGDTAKVLVQSPFAEAVAVLAVDRGGILRHEARRVKGSQVTFDVPITAASAPFVHAVVTLLPVSSPNDAAFRVAAARLPVATEDAHLDVSVAADRKSADAREQVTLTVTVSQRGKPVAGADVTLAMVDEGVLRLTAFHAKDPTDALHPAHALGFSAYDSRQLLFRRREKAHVAGGGGADEDSALDTRTDIVETAAWLPALVTDASGKATAKVTLPDNLGEFRMMATAVDAAGSAGVAEGSLLVTRPFLLAPVIPPFVLDGDKVEIGVMAHNNTDAEVKAKVRFWEEVREVTLPAHGHVKVAVPFTARETKKVTFALEVGGKTRDKIERTVQVGFGGIEERPTLSGVFRGSQEVTVAIPDDARFADDEKLFVRAGAALYPELGHRLSYLLDYPHGCVEQTTSGTLPLLAARTLLPWTGSAPISEDELRKRIKAGVARLATMKTSSGGLAYWPGGSDPNVFGTVYATRALLRAKEEGIKEEGLLPGVLQFLGRRLDQETDPAMRVSIAEVLAQAQALPESSADSLYASREKLNAFGLASLALALSSLPKQEDRVRSTLDALEAAFDDKGVPKVAHGSHDHHYWGSADRDRAQALIALARLRPGSRLVPILGAKASRKLDSYTTQSTAWSLIALADYVGKALPAGAVDVKVVVPGFVVDKTRSLGGGNNEVAIPLRELRGKRVVLRLQGDDKTPVAFAMTAKYARLGATSAREARRSRNGPSVYRVFTDAAGRPVDLGNLKPGDVVRVALRVDVPSLEEYRAGYLAVSDPIAAGLEPIKPDLATVAQVDAVGREHPFHQAIAGGAVASHVDVRLDRVNVYYDRVYSGSPVYATYLLRATTPGEFALPPARAELMYEPGSEGYSDAARVVVR